MCFLLLTTLVLSSLLSSLLSHQVNWAFEASPAASGLEEDEGWASDSLGPRLEPKPSRELRELVSRVASLEAQLKSSRLDGKGGLAEEEKCATWPG